MEAETAALETNGANEILSSEVPAQWESSTFRGNGNRLTAKSRSRVHGVGFFIDA